VWDDFGCELRFTPEHAVSSWATLCFVKIAPLQSVLVLVGAWLATLGACGRTEPEVAGTYGYAASDQGDDDTIGSGGTSVGGTSHGGTNAVGGSHTGGTHGSGGANGGTSTGKGGTQGHGGDAMSVGGSGVGGTGVGGTGIAGTAGNVAVGGAATGGDFFGGGTSGSGGSNQTGGSANGGDSNQTGGTGGTTGGTGGTGGSSMGGMAGVPNSISCDGMRCDASASVCCKRRGSPSTCEPSGTMCTGGATLTCSGSSACGAGQVCCFHANQSLCQATCDVSVGSPGNPPTIILCDSDADCADGEVCVIAPRGIAYCAMTQ
jgi:hypothetical protein